MLSESWSHRLTNEKRETGHDSRLVTLESETDSRAWPRWEDRWRFRNRRRAEAGIAER